MGSVIAVMTMSLDGFVTAANTRPDAPLGDGGERLMEWAFGEDARDRETLERGIDGLGAVVAGRRTYDTSVPWWGANGPSGPARKPVFVVSHDAPRETPANGVYTFVNGFEAAIAQSCR